MRPSPSATLIGIAAGLIALAVAALAGLVAFLVHRRPLLRRPFPEGRLRG